MSMFFKLFGLRYATPGGPPDIHGKNYLSDLQFAKTGDVLVDDYGNPISFGVIGIPYGVPPEIYDLEPQETGLWFNLSTGSVWSRTLLADGVTVVDVDTGPSGNGDMRKAVYDTNDDGIVDAADQLKAGLLSVTATEAINHIADLSIHRALNDAITTSTNLWSAFKISGLLALKADLVGGKVPTTQLPYFGVDTDGIVRGPQGVQATQHRFLKADGTWMTPVRWVECSAGYTASSGDGILADTSASDWILQLPADPEIGDFVCIVDVKGAFSTYNLGIDGQGEVVLGDTDILYCDIPNSSFDLVYSGPAVGWKLKDYLPEGTRRPEAGPQGLQGPQGWQGNQGFMGAQGNAGVQGATGFGSQGLQGRQGFQGWQGFQGNQGRQGWQGPQGWQGVLGLQGAQGIQGVMGVQGELGPQGAQGFMGWQGDNPGPQGPQGTNPGVQGPQGGLPPASGYQSDFYNGLNGFIAGAICTMTDGATIVMDGHQGWNFSVALGGDRTLVPLNITAGQGGVIIIKQDASGLRLVTWNSAFKFSGGTKPTLSTGANQTDIISYMAESSSVIHCAMASRGSA